MDDEPEDDPVCPICDSFQEWQDCYRCGGDGYTEDRDEETGWVLSDVAECYQCRGRGGWWQCANLPHRSKDGK